MAADPGGARFRRTDHSPGVRRLWRRARSARGDDLWYAAHAWDRGLDETAWLAPLLRAHASEVATQMVTNTTQVDGGMGFTYECDMHIFFKRVGYDRQILGTPGSLRQEAADRQYPATTADRPS